jgi:hypothetical protein
VRALSRRCWFSSRPLPVGLLPHPAALAELRLPLHGVPRPVETAVEPPVAVRDGAGLLGFPPLGGGPAYAADRELVGRARWTSVASWERKREDAGTLLSAGERVVKIRLFRDGLHGLAYSILLFPTACRADVAVV